MTYLTRIPRIRDYRVFRDYSWPADLHPFARVNVIYGWNGSGKTTLSSLLEHVERAESISEGDVRFEFNGAEVRGADLALGNLPATRVFNRGFVDRTINAVNSGIGAVYYLGEESIEKQVRVEELRDQLLKAKEQATAARSTREAAGGAFDRFCTEQAKTVKQLLLGSSAHANYNRRNFEQTVADMDAGTVATARLADHERERLQRQRREQAKPPVARVTLNEPAFEQLRARAAQLLHRTVAAEVLDELAADPAVATWVETGLRLHAGEQHSDSCRFCGSVLTEARRNALAGHFNDAFARFQADLTSQVRAVKAAIDDVASPPSAADSAFYEELVEPHREAAGRLSSETRSASDYLRALLGALERKKAEPFGDLGLAALLPDSAPTAGALAKAVEAVNAVVDRHKATTDELQQRVTTACTALEWAFVADAFDEYTRLVAALTEAVGVETKLAGEPKRIQNEVEGIERAIVESRRPAEELNAELQSYLGRDELKFDVRDNGYVLLRGGQQVSHLSEGEKTAIALLYFLKSLEGRAFDRTKGIVVIDDPVSSLDANGLFNAFSFMKERTKDCGQLFVLTHSFAFFRQVKNWVNHLPDQRKKDPARRPGRLYFLSAVPDAAGRRTAVLGPLDRLLHEFESEYQFLFRCVHTEAHRPSATADLEPLYGLPNVARRLLEAFLAFKQPDRSPDLHGHLEAVIFDPMRKTRLLRFLNTYSHANLIAESEHDLHLLAEAPEVMRDLLALIKHVDAQHYAGLERLVAPVEAEGDDDGGAA